MSQQLTQWRGQFGREYADRNVVDWRTRVDTLNRLLPRDINDVCEIGTNRGQNLHAVRAARGDDIYVCGVEPADYARGIAKASGLVVHDGTIYAIPYEANGFDVVMTSGVLIHLPPSRLPAAIAEMHRVSARYLLAIEYHAEEDTELEYRGLPDMLWRRDYGAHFLRVFPSLRLVEVTDDVPGFDGARAWVMEKAQ